MATFLGVLLAFWLDGFSARAKKKQQKKEERSILYRELNLILETLIYNRDHLKSLDDAINHNSQKILFPINLSTWDTFKADIHKYLNNPQLSAAISHHFMLLSYLGKLEDLQLQTTIESIEYINLTNSEEILLINEKIESHKKLTSTEKHIAEDRIRADKYQGIISAINVNLNDYLKELTDANDKLRSEILIETANLIKN